MTDLDEIDPQQGMSAAENQFICLQVVVQV